MMRWNIGHQAQLWIPGMELTGNGLGSEIEDVLEMDLPRVLVLDLRQVKAVDSGGLAWLVNLAERQRWSRSELMLLAPSAEVRGLLNEARATRKFKMVTDLDEASNLLARQAGSVRPIRIVFGN